MNQSTPLSKQDNIVSHVTRVYIEERISKANNPYHILCTEFNLPNDKIYTYETLVSREQLPLIEISEPIATDELFEQSK